MSNYNLTSILKSAIHLIVEDDLLGYETKAVINKLAGVFQTNFVLMYTFDLENQCLGFVDSSLAQITDETSQILDAHIPDLILKNQNHTIIQLDWVLIKRAIASATTDIDFFLIPLKYQNEIIGCLFIGLNKTIIFENNPENSWLVAILANLLGTYVVYQTQAGYIESEDTTNNPTEPQILEYANNSTNSKQIVADRNFFRQFIHEFDRASRYKFSLSLICIDIDHFKEINEVYGGDQGQTIMDSILKFLTEHSRKIDLVGRYGGEKFILVLCDTPLNQATRYAERLRQQFENTVFFLDEGISFIKLTVSLGVSSLKEHLPESPAQMIEFGDIAVYMAKKSGRNKVISYSEIIHNKVKGEGKA